MTVVEVLFEGMPAPFGGWSNQRELAGLCPQEFRSDQNPWGMYVRKVLSEGTNISNWKWKSQEDEIRKKQFKCLFGLLYSATQPYDDRVAVCGWMISNMLQELPQHKPYPKRK